MAFRRCQRLQETAILSWAIRLGRPLVLNKREKGKQQAIQPQVQPRSPTGGNRDVAFSHLLWLHIFE